MSYQKDFFDLSYRYAQRVSDLAQISLADALLNYTNLYLRFGLDRSFNPHHPVWISFVEGLPTEEDPVDYMFAFFLECDRRHPVVNNEPTFGCFSYAVWSEQRIRLHFNKGATLENGPLSMSQMVDRLKELTDLCEHVKNHVPDASMFLGGSWLYNIESYRRLFPPAFLATEHPSYEDFQFLALWGQFLDRQGHVRPMMAQAFFDKIEAAACMDDLTHAFPYPVLRLDAPPEVFYRFYKSQ